MKRDFQEKTSQDLRYQRNIFASLTVLLAVSLIPLTLLFFLKKERVVVIPPIVEKEFWVEAGRVSPTYLEQYGYFLGQLLLSKSAHSAASQRNILLRHTDPLFVETLKQKLNAEEQLLQKQNASYTFFPITIHADAQKNEVLIEGDRVFYVAGKQVSSEKEGYIFSFRYTGSRLLLSSITAKENRREGCTK